VPPTMDGMDHSPAAEPEGPLVVADDAAEPADPEVPEEPAEQPLVVSVGEQAAEQPDWWHRDHPTFTAIAGFFCGLMLATVVPGAFVATVRALTNDRTAEEMFPFVLLFLVIPFAMVAFPQTRRFGKYLLLGIVIALAVIIGVGSFVFWLMLKTS
jgi:hypothetical protein